MEPVTQLYLSIDAADPDSLRKVDRPLFRDYWERLTGCLDEIAKKRQRTVFRLTLVKGFNAEEVEGYAQMVRRGRPDFVEIKGVTFCGFGDASPLSLSNVPFHEEVVAFAAALAAQLDDDYAIACEHEHSCSVLIANRRFHIDGQWHTWINYSRFRDLAAAARAAATNGSDAASAATTATFDSMAYSAPTPAWATFASAERGFDPQMRRVFRGKARYEAAGGGEAYKAQVAARRMAEEAGESGRAMATVAVPP
ncbi:S-adenosyl-L-methionine-dependent tRNA 4-demethylwyosine synthase [Cladochytrium tenue]|nr:S-adenosyl-L-methionine-dependent tRNA 4-demethylwyosine synthase [Cladochytrium tenue]